MAFLSVTDDFVANGSFECFLVIPATNQFSADSAGARKSQTIIL